jgi:hypothetical protein
MLLCDDRSIDEEEACHPPACAGMIARRYSLL